MINDVKIDHGIYDPFHCSLGFISRRGGHYIPLPEKIRDYLMDKFFKHRRTVQFTVGTDLDLGIPAVSVCHPNDCFSRRIGRKIVLNRIEEMRTNGDNFDQEKYPWIHKLVK